MTPPPFAIPPGLEDLLPAFVAEMARDGARLAALAKDGGEDLHEHIHAMRGKCAMFGEDVLYDLLSRLEHCARETPGEGVNSLIAHILARATQLCEYEKSKGSADPP